MPQDNRMRFILLWCKKDGSYANFERFACKRLSTARRWMRQLWTEDAYGYASRLRRDGVTHARIHASDDGYNWDKTPLVVVPVDELDG